MFNYDTIPVDYMKGAIRRYLEQGIEPGSFLEAVLRNDLKRAVACADNTNIHQLVEWVTWLTWEAPASSWGSKDDYEFWIKRKQMERENG